MPYSAALQQITREHDYDNRGMQLSNNKFHSDYTGWIKKNKLLYCGRYFKG